MVKMKFSVKENVSTKEINKAVRRGAPTTLRSAGAYLRKTIRNSIKERKNPKKASRPGMPPHSHFGVYESGGKEKVNPGYKNLIFFSTVEHHRKYDSLVVGPIGGKSKMPSLQEWGGFTKINSIEYPDKWENGFKIGDEGPVNTKNWSKKKDHIIRVDEHKDPKNNRTVVWIKIRTKNQ